MQRIRIATGTPWEPIIGYSRLVRAGDHVYVTGTTATLPEGGHTGDGDAYVQACQALRNIERALVRAGASLEDVVRTRIFVTDVARDWRAVGRAHAEFLGRVRPATSMVEVSRLVEEWMLVEIEADAVVGARAEEAGGVAIEEAAFNDHEAVAALLGEAGLPVPGPEDAAVRMLVAREGRDVVGCAAWERHGAHALLRSVAVRRDRRRAGLGRALVNEALRRLATSGVGATYLLTTDAQGFFARLGFAAVPREAVPAEVLASREFAMACCEGAACMRLG